MVFGEQHLRRVLRSYARYYNEARTHRSLNKDAPLSRAVQPIGRIVSHALVGGLHHRYNSNLSFCTHTWAMDFVHDQLATGRKLRVLTIEDTFSRFSPALEPRLSFRGADVVEVLEKVGREMG